VGGKGDRPIVDRWWIDQGKAARGGAPAERPPATFGGRFFRSGAGFDQDRAQRRLTDLNLKWFDEAPGPLGSWVVVRTLGQEGFPQGRLERVKVALPIPPEGRAVLVDSGNAVRAIITGAPFAERLVEVRLGDDNSFDAWVFGEWVREALFRNFEDGLRRAPALVCEYLTTARATPVG
jgi:hypothetical protein